MKELKDDEILEYLMTSDFLDNHRPDDYKYLLNKFKFFYKILYAKHQNYKIDKEANIKDIISKIDCLEKQIYNEQVKSSGLQNDIDQFKTRKLTLNERFHGKIKYEKTHN